MKLFAVLILSAMVVGCTPRDEKKVRALIVDLEEATIPTHLGRRIRPRSSSGISAATTATAVERSR